MNVANNFHILHHNKDILVVQTNGADETSQQGSNDDPCYGNFNLGLHVGDDSAQVLANRAQLLAQLNQYLSANSSSDIGITSPIASIHWLNQTHSNHVINIDTFATNYSISEKNKLSSPYNLLPPNADAQISASPHKALAVMTADCVPIVLYNPQTKQIAAIHAGWKGLANGVIAQTLAMLDANQSATHKTNKSHWQAWIGACICQNCYEVSLDVVDKLLHGCQQVAQSNIGIQNIDRLREQAVKPHATDANKAWLDLVAITVAQLAGHGVEVKDADIKDVETKSLQVEGAKVQTADSNDLLTKTHHSSCHKSHSLDCSYGNGEYYSYRRMTHQKRPSTGRMALLIVRLQ